MAEEIPSSIVMTVHLSSPDAQALLGGLAGVDIVHLEDTGAIAPGLTFAAVIAVMGALMAAGVRGGC